MIDLMLQTEMDGRAMFSIEEEEDAAAASAANEQKTLKSSDLKVTVSHDPGLESRPVPQQNYLTSQLHLCLIGLRWIPDTFGYIRFYNWSFGCKISKIVILISFSS